MVEIKRNPSAGDFCFEAKTDGEILAQLHGEIIDGVFHIKTYDGDQYLFDGVCRASLNSAEHEGASSAVIEETVKDYLLMLFGYKRKINSISSFFENEQGCSGCRGGCL